MAQIENVVVNHEIIMHVLLSATITITKTVLQHRGVSVCMKHVPVLSQRGTMSHIHE